MRKLSPTFFDDVYEVVKLVPKGRVTSYGAIANYLGAKGSARIVGWAMNQTPQGQEIPAHRVVNRLGVLSGKSSFSQPNLMEARLMEEGVHLEGDKIVNFKEVFWDPMEELTL